MIISAYMRNESFLLGKSIFFSLDLT